MEMSSKISLSKGIHFSLKIYTTVYSEQTFLHFVKMFVTFHRKGRPSSFTFLFIHKSLIFVKGSFHLTISFFVPVCVCVCVRDRHFWSDLLFSGLMMMMMINNYTYQTNFPFSRFSMTSISHHTRFHRYPRPTLNTLVLLHGSTPRGSFQRYPFSPSNGIPPFSLL